MSASRTDFADTAVGKGTPLAEAARLAQRCAGVACGIAAMAAAGWVLDLRLLAGQWETYLPMAPSTALAFVFLGGGIFCNARWPSGNRARYVALAGAGVAASLGLLILWHFVVGQDSGVERALAGTNDMFGPFLVGRMSPLTAVTFLLQSGALMLMLVVTRWGVAASVAALLALLATVINLVVLVGYGYGVPVLYGGSIVPVAVPTALAFVLLGVGQVNLLLPQIPALRAWRRGTLRGVLLRAVLPAVFLLIVLDGWADVVIRGSVRSVNLAVWHAVTALVSGGLIVVIVGWIARRTGDALERTEEALIASEVRYRRLFESAKDGILILDAETGVIVDVNPFLVELLGFSRESFFGKKVWDLGLFKDIIANQDAFAELQRVEYVRYRDKPLETKDGRRIDVEFVSNVYMVNDHKVIQCNVRDISERTRADAALRESDSRFRTYIEHAPDGVFVINAAGFYQDVNVAACSLLGYSRDEFLLMHASQVVAEEAPGEVRASIDALRRDGRYSGEFRFVRKDGSVFVGLLGSTKIDDDQYLGFVTDITEHKRAETALRASEGSLRDAQRLAHIGSWQWTAATDAVTWSEELCQIAGRDPRLPAPGFSEMSACYSPESWQRLNAAVARALQSGESYQLDLEMVRPDGTTRQTSTLGKADRDPSGTIVGLFGTVQDTTERRRREEEQARLLAIIDESPDFIGVADLQGNLLYHNRAARRMVGLPDDADLSHMRIRDMHPAWAAKLVEDEGIPTILRDGTWRNENMLLHRNGSEIPVSQILAIHRNAAGEPQFVSTIMRDITDRKRAEVETAKLGAQLQQAQKMESVGRLAGGVAHDFNNMLGAILGLADLALVQVGPVHPIHADLEQLRQVALRSADLTRQLLAFARQQAIAPKVLILNDSVEGMLKMLRRLIGENIDLNWKPGADLWQVNVDPSQIDQIMVNLCVNARDAISGVGKMTIETANSSLDAAYSADHVGCVLGEYVRLNVSDDGCGMDKETLAHIFEPFFTTKAIGRGTGLGLATVYGIVKQNNGFIDVQSQPGQGSTFTVYLPRDGGAAKQARTDTATEPLPGGHQTILLVEDDPVILTVAQRMLEQHGYTVLSASTPTEALRLAQAHASEIHLLMTDVIMPEMNGRILATKLLSVHPHLRCLYMSGYPADVIAHQGVLEERVQFLQKPFSTEDLAAKVRDVLDAGR